jgi:hypothetical protein
MDQGVLIEKKDGRYYKPCPECGEMQSYLRLCYAKQSLELNKTCKKCSNRKTENCHRGLYNGIPITWFNKFKNSSELRNITFNISIEDVFEMYNKQNGKCFLSGKEIGWVEVGQKHTASLDRIDSSIGYELNNIQLVHKDINFMKQSYSQDYFIEMCKFVSENVKGS